MSKYPRIVTRTQGKGKICIVCKRRTTDTANIEVSYMRGDDEVVPACREHSKDEVIQAAFHDHAEGPA